MSGLEAGSEKTLSKRKIVTGWHVTLVTVAAAGHIAAACNVYDGLDAHASVLTHTIPGDQSIVIELSCPTSYRHFDRDPKGCPGCPEDPRNHHSSVGPHY